MSRARDAAMHLTLDDLIACGLAAEEAQVLLPRIHTAEKVGPAEAIWRRISQTILTPHHPFALHQFLFSRVYEHRDCQQGPAPAWIPTPESIRETNIARFLLKRGLS